MAGMYLATRYCQENREIKNIVFLSDSSSALKNITDIKPHPSQEMSILFTSLARKFLSNNEHNITLQWIPGHKGFELNERADKLARKGRKKPGGFITESLSYYAEKRSRIVLQKWCKLIKNSPFTGAFGEANALEPPTTKPGKVFTQLENQPEVFGRLTQVRMMHGYNPPYYERMKIPHEPECICGDTIPTTPATRYQDHIFHNCRAYDEHRHVLTAVHRDHSPPVLLSGTKGLLAIAKFLRISGAFTSTGEPLKPPAPPELPSLDLSDTASYPTEPPDPH